MDDRVARTRSVRQVVRGRETADGSGVSLTRVIGGPDLPQLDPFLLLDDFRSDDPRDYIGGFPPHPHRGFETVTYMIAGRMRHHDNAGHEGVIESGGVQWMTAGRGVIHSEMPEQEEGLLAGLQLWVNLPARSKMAEPRYQEFGPESVPHETREDGVEVRVLAGTTSCGSQGPVRDLVVPITFLDCTLPAGSRLREALPEDRNAFLYILEGEILVGETPLIEHDLAVLGDGDTLALEASSAARLLVVAGTPIGEPVARRGPFVMNTDKELLQAFRDYQTGAFGPDLDDRER
ncbi:MAG TPA: pirin family protein [Gammaproteobacteria bacterium]|nr:pirin family protein [Gammaproteobacteria bacterium]